MSMVTLRTRQIVRVPSSMLFEPWCLGRVAVLPEGGLQRWQGLSGRVAVLGRV
jgi:hypothetical protein